jgi:hypothetical protein
MAKPPSAVRTAVLPNELLDHIISYILPEDDRTILEPGMTTKTLLSLTRVSPSMYPVATRHLRHHCVYIDTEERLHRLLRCLKWQKQHSLAQFTQIYLAPYLHTERMETSTTAALRDLLLLLNSSLKRLILDVPVYSKKWMKADGRRAQLRMLHEGLVSLRQLEEFVSISSDIGLHLGITLGLRTASEAFDFSMYNIVSNAWWTAWPRLRRIAVYASQGVLKPTMEALPSELELLVSVGGLHFVATPMDWVQGRSSAWDKPLKFLDVCIARYHQEALKLADEQAWDAVDGYELQYELFDIPGEYNRDDDQTELLQNFMRRGALRGDLWDLTGRPIQEAIAERDSVA